MFVVSCVWCVTSHTSIFSLSALYSSLVSRIRANECLRGYVYARDLQCDYKLCGVGWRMWCLCHTNYTLCVQRLLIAHTWINDALCGRHWRQPINGHCHSLRARSPCEHAIDAFCRFYSFFIPHSYEKKLYVKRTFNRVDTYRMRVCAPITVDDGGWIHVSLVCNEFCSRESFSFIFGVVRIPKNFIEN